MSATATETKPQVNGDETYSSKFLPKVTSIPVINSLQRQFFMHVPYAEAIAKHLTEHLTKVFTYTNNTPIRPVLIKLDILAANGVSKLEKEVPFVTTPTEEVLKKTRVDSFIDTFTHYYVTSIDFLLSVFNAYQGVFDPLVKPILDRTERFLNLTPAKDQTKMSRFVHIRGVLVEKLDSRVTPVLNKTKEVGTSIYSNKVLPIVQYPLTQFNTRKAKLSETYSPYVSELKSRYTKAESAAKDVWAQTKPKPSGPNGVIPTIKSGIFVTIAFGYNMVNPESDTKTFPKRFEDQINGLFSGIEIVDGEIKKRPNGNLS